MKISALLLFAGAFGFLTSHLPAATTILDDTFADGERTVQNLPDSMAFYVGGGPSSGLAATTGSMTWTTAGAGRTMLGYFGTNVDGTLPVSLAVGETLQLVIDFVLSGTVNNVDNSLRIGLFNSTASTGDPQRVSEDGFENSNQAFAGYSGYAMMANIGNTTATNGTSGAMTLRERTNTASTSLLNSVTGVYTQLGGSVTVPSALSTETAYSASFVLTRSAEEQLDITYTLTGGSLGDGYTVTRSDTSGITTAFDTLAFNVVSAQGVNYTFTSFSATYTPIPEPTVSGLLGVFGLLTGGSLLRRFGR